MDNIFRSCSCAASDSHGKTISKTVQISDDCLFEPVDCEKLTQPAKKINSRECCSSSNSRNNDSSFGCATQVEDSYHKLFKLKDGMARCLKGGVIMDVTTPEEASIAESAGAVAVMALERIPYDIRKDGGIARMSDPALIKQIKKEVSIPVMAKVRIGHSVEAQVLQSINVDFIDESEVLTPADNKYHINKTKFKTPFVCGAATFEQAVRRIHEGAAMIRTKGEAGTGNIVEAVSHARDIAEGIEKVVNMTSAQRDEYASHLSISPSILHAIARLKSLPVVNFSAGGVATPADAALMMQLGMDGVFVGSGIFKSSNPKAFAQAIVKAVANYNSPEVIASVSESLGSAMQSNYNDLNNTTLKTTTKTVPASYARRGPD